MIPDLQSLWDFSDLDGSEARFTAALAEADAPETLILRTQIARTWGLRAEFARAREILQACEADRDASGGEVVTRWWLEWGRTWASAAHRRDEVTDADRDEARRAYEAAFLAAQGAGLDGLAVDALHMLAVVVTAPDAQAAANRRALDFLRQSDQPAARAWEASVRNNLGCALHDAGDLGGALAEFEAALALQQAAGRPGAERIAWWMVAWTLRGLGRLPEALTIQERLERDCDAAGDPDPYVFEELEALYTAVDRPQDAARAAGRRTPDS
jgi:hypothetical protein